MDGAKRQAGLFLMPLFTTRSVTLSSPLCRRDPEICAAFCNFGLIRLGTSSTLGVQGHLDRAGVLRNTAWSAFGRGTAARNPSLQEYSDAMASAAG